MNTAIVIALALGAYLLGSIPSAVWIGKIFYGVDVRTKGSGNAGTTNVLRVLGAKAALPVFVIDMLKGYAAVSLATLGPIAPESPNFLYVKMALCVLAVVGHMYPVFAGFRGGKGVATLVGAMFAFSVGGILLSLATFVVIVSLTHYVSVGSMVGGLLLPFYAALTGDTDWRLILFFALISLLLFYTHRTNIGRLLHGTENKTHLFGRSKQGEQK
ncbi:MAG: glycerol-3-phosphate 1-O-acyltransferase PlsY [Tidjanibacter sp.]|nr:glycerol-3-phosphate 1-O-acyltransferase PlsY [Tidjanibacter sp.]